MFKFDYNGQKLKVAHVVIFDTNGEYKEAFGIDEKYKVNPFYINEDGLKIPYWFMNFDDMDYLFEPTTGTQAPILKRALALAKSHTKATEVKCLSKIHINKLSNFLDNIESQDWKANKAILEESESVFNSFTNLKNQSLVDFDLAGICDGLDKIKSEKTKLSVNSKGYIVGNPDIDVLSSALDKIRAELDLYRKQLVDGINSENRDIDFPIYFEFKELMSSCFELAIQESAVSQDKINEYVSTLKLRMQSFVDDIRLAEPLMLNKQKDINGALIQFLAFVLGDYCTIYDKTEYNETTYKEYYKKSTNDREKMNRNQITIIDMSLLPFQVLETITGLVGRMILEFLSRFDKAQRGTIRSLSPSKKRKIISL